MFESELNNAWISSIISIVFFFIFVLKAFTVAHYLTKKNKLTRNCFTLFSLHFFFISFQAILFYTPRWLWKSWEGGKIHALMMDLDIGLGTDTEKNHKKKILIQYLWENLRFLSTQ